MGETEVATGSRKVIDFGEQEEVEGNQIVSRNYRFSEIGEPVPIKRDVDSEFDIQSPPSRPLAVSERFGVLFVAHSSGFVVARTKDVMQSADNIKKGAKGSSIQELCVVDVPIGKVSILALSADSSSLAASIGSHLHFFSVAALLDQKQESSFSYSLNDLSCIEDLRWSTKLEDGYLVLSSTGKLHYGAGHNDIKDVMDDVDAVEWSVEGKFIAVARKNLLSILSSKFKEKLRMMLSFKSLAGVSDANCIVKVDSIRWVRPDSIILGCYQLSDDGKEENYMVQVITGNGSPITDASSNPVVLSFSDAFLCLNDDAILRSGPHMCLSYLDTCELAFTANRKNMDQHIVLFGWSVDEKNEAVMIEIGNDVWLPRIAPQGNGDDNLLLGISIEKVSCDRNVKLILGEEDKEVQPCCILLCLTIDGKLSMFHFASAAGASVPPQLADSVSDEEEDSPGTSSGDGMLKLPATTSNMGQNMDKTLPGLQSKKVIEDELNEEGKAAADSETFSSSAQQEASFVKLNDDRYGREQPIFSKQGGNSEHTRASQRVDPWPVVRDFSRSETNEHFGARTRPGSFSQQNMTDMAKKPFQVASLKTGIVNSEPNLSKQIHNVEEMARELDALLECIEKPGGFNDMCIALQKNSVIALEERMWMLSDRCRTRTEIIDRWLGEIQLLLDKTVQVLARKIYMEGLVKQATDSQYWDLWNRQKLSSELEIKHRHILEISQSLTNQLIGLERHLHAVELNFFDESSGVQMNRRSIQKHGPSRHIQSLHSLHNTMSAQLAAAEQLSQRLSEQMAVLSIESPPLRKQNVRKELFDAIGISHDGAAFNSLDEEKVGSISSKKEGSVSFCSAVANSKSTRHQSNSGKSSEPETARRRRDSIGQELWPSSHQVMFVTNSGLPHSWASFEPPKTTIKRMLLQEDHQVSPGRLSSSIVKEQLNLQGSAVSHVNLASASTLLHSSKSKGSQDPSIKQSSGAPLNSSIQSARPDISKSFGNNAFSSGAASKVGPTISQKAVKGVSSTTEIFQNLSTSFEKSDSIANNNLKSSHQFDNFQYLDQTPSFPRKLSSAIKSSEFSDSSGKETVVLNSTLGNGNQKSAVNESSSFLSRNSMDPPLPTMSASHSSPIFYEKSSPSSTSTSGGQPCELISASSKPSSLPVALLANPSFLSKLTAPTSSSAISLSQISTGSINKMNANATVSLSRSSTAFSFSPSTTSLAFEHSVSASILSPTNSALKSSKLDTKTEPQEALVPEFISTTNEKPSPLHSEIPSDTSSLKFGPSVQSMPPRKVSTRSPYGSRLSFSAMTSPALSVTSNLNPEQSVQTVLPSEALSSSGAATGTKNNSSDVPFSQGDDMEEEAPETTQLTMANLSGFGIGSTSISAAPKSHPFGAPFGDTAVTSVSPFTMTPPSSGMFRPASFSIQSPPLSQPPQQTNIGAFSGGFSSGAFDHTSAGKGFGQPAQIGSGQQALGSVLGAFGQSRQLGTGLPGTVASQSAFGSGFTGNQSIGGFSNSAIGSGFAAVAPTGGGFAAAASAGGGFAGMGPTGGGFGGLAPSSSGFSAAATGVGGFAATVSGSGFSGAGGFGAFSKQGGSGAFSAFDSSGGTGRPSSQLFTQMRK